jgi:hypothetical protein
MKTRLEIKFALDLHGLHYNEILTIGLIYHKDIKAVRIKRQISLLISFIGISALFSVYAGIVADEPLHRLNPDPHCAICQAVNALGVVINVQFVPQISDQFFNIIETYLFERNIYIDYQTNPIRGPPFQILCV